MRQRNIQWVEEQMASQCAPLLAGLKPSNLLILPTDTEEELQRVLAGTCFSGFRLAEYDAKCVYLLYRANELLLFLTEPEVQKLLLELGYTVCDFRFLMEQVAGRYSSHKKCGTEFPHELGLLLGYPAVDVRGFVEHKGKDYLYSGYWKVYGNVTETARLFQEFGRAKRFVVQMVEEGYTIPEIVNMYYRNRQHRLAVS